MWRFRADVVCIIVQCAYGSEFTRESAIAWAAIALDRLIDVLSLDTYACKDLEILLLIVGSH